MTRFYIFIGNIVTIALRRGFASKASVERYRCGGGRAARSARKRGCSAGVRGTESLLVTAFIRVSTAWSDPGYPCIYMYVYISEGLEKEGVFFGDAEEIVVSIGGDRDDHELNTTNEWRILSEESNTRISPGRRRGEIL
ncbi:hypothetical protein Trydic_g21744 [Trypoxylus dichotomus]